MFRFKQFAVNDEGATMKVGTDGVLVAALAPTLSCGKILDIGTGSGVVALILAQLNPNCNVDAVEIDRHSAEVAMRNFEFSPWSERLKVFALPVQTFAENAPLYDLIVSNPPFFENSLKSPSEQRNMARHNSSLPFGELASSVKKLISPKGLFTIILPCNEAEKFEPMANDWGLFAQKRTTIFSKPEGRALRTVTAFGAHRNSNPATDSLEIHNADGSFSEPYRNITRELYLWEK